MSTTSCDLLPKTFLKVLFITKCQKFFRFLPVTYQIDIRTAKFLQKFMTSDNSICRLFVKQAGTNLKKIFSSYGNVKSVYEIMQ